MEGIKGIAISRRMYESLEPLKLSKNIRNTEAEVLEFKHKGLTGPHVLKKCIIEKVLYLEISLIHYIS